MSGLWCIYFAAIFLNLIFSYSTFRKDPSRSFQYGFDNSATNRSSSRCVHTSCRLRWSQEHVCRTRTPLRKRNQRGAIFRLGARVYVSETIHSLRSPSMQITPAQKHTRFDSQKSRRLIPSKCAETSLGGLPTFVFRVLARFLEGKQSHDNTVLTAITVR